METATIETQIPVLNPCQESAARRPHKGHTRRRGWSLNRGLTLVLAQVFTLVFALALASTATYAQDTAVLSECHELADDRARLDCYDQLSGRVPMWPEPTTSDTIDSGQQQVVDEQATDGRAGADQVAVAQSPVDAAERLQPSILDAAWGFAEDSKPYPISMYHPNYVLPLSYSGDVNNNPFSPVFEGANLPDQNLDSVEAKFQLSLKARLWTTDDRRWGLWMAYTQQNHWQVYNGEISRSFRETNYMPEVFVGYRLDKAFAGFDWKLLNFGYTHQSNGRADPISRSWDRIFAEVGLERGNLALMMRVWTRLSENADEDDNPDITDFHGHSEVNALYRWNGNSLALMGRGNLDTGKGAVRLGWFSRPVLGPLRGYVQVFSGYGESMIDYNWNQTTIGMGLALSDGL